MTIIATYACLLTAAAVVSAAVVDFMERRIPNVQVGIMAASTLVYLAVAERSHLIEHLASGALASLICISLFARDKIGGGDAKMIAVLAFWFLPSKLFSFGLWVMLCGGILGGLFILAIFGRLAILRIVPKLKLPVFVERAGMPYGVATACGFAVAAWRAYA